MSNIFFTSDSHFGHKNIIKYCNRPYASTEEMNEDLVKKWNEVVSKNDTIYHLGDVTWGSFDIHRLNGNKFLIIGNHDNLSQIGRHFYDTRFYLELKGVLPKNRSIPLFHYPIESWNGKFHGAIHLHGHSHGTVDNTGLLRFDVGVDCWDMKPISIEQVLEMVPKRKEEAAVIEASTKRDAEFKELNRMADDDSKSQIP